MALLSHLAAMAPGINGQYQRPMRKPKGCPRPRPPPRPRRPWNEEFTRPTPRSRIALAAPAAPPRLTCACGTVFLVESSKFCHECGAKRPVPVPALSVQEEDAQLVGMLHARLARREQVAPGPSPRQQQRHWSRRSAADPALTPRPPAAARRQLKQAPVAMWSTQQWRAQQRNAGRSIGAAVGDERYYEDQRAKRREAQARRRDMEHERWRQIEQSNWMRSKRLPRVTSSEHALARARLELAEVMRRKHLLQQKPGGGGGGGGSAEGARGAFVALDGRVADPEGGFAAVQVVVERHPTLPPASPRRKWQHRGGGDSAVRATVAEEVEKLDIPSFVDALVDEAVEATSRSLGLVDPKPTTTALIVEVAGQLAEALVEEAVQAAAPATTVALPGKMHLASSEAFSGAEVMTFDELEADENEYGDEPPPPTRAEEAAMEAAYEREQRQQQSAEPGATEAQLEAELQAMLRRPVLVGPSDAGLVGTPRTRLRLEQVLADASTFEAEESDYAPRRR